MYQPRIPISFTSVDGSDADTADIVFTFPLADYAWDSDQGLYTPSTPLTGAHYEFDLLGTARAVKQAASETLHFTFRDTTPAAVDTAVDAALSAIARIGGGKLWAEDATGEVRWSYARALAMPSFRWKAGDQFRKTASVNWRRSSDWFLDTDYVVTHTINADPKTITVTNPGTEDAYAIVMIMKGTYTDFLIHNNENDYEVGSETPGAAASDWLKMDARTGRWYKSVNSGVAYTADYANAVIGDVQVQQMIFAPGDNEVIVTGANGSDLYITFPVPTL